MRYALRDLVGKSSLWRSLEKKMAVVRQNQLEYFLQGSIGKDSVHTLLHRLRGLCDGVSRQVTTFGDHEMVFTLGKSSSLFCLACQEMQFFFSLTRPWFFLLTVKNWNLFLHLQIEIFQGLCLKLLLQLSFSDVYLFLKGIQAVISPLE